MIILSLFLMLAPVDGIETVMTLHAGPFSSMGECEKHATLLIAQAVDLDDGDEVFHECVTQSKKEEL